MPNEFKSNSLQISLNKRTFFNDIIDFQIKSNYECNNCKSEQYGVDDLGNILIDIKEFFHSTSYTNENVTIDKLIEYYYKQHHFGKSNKEFMPAKCSNCLKRSTFSRYREVTMLPEILVIHLDWISWYDDWSSNFQKPFKGLFQEDLDMSKYFDYSNSYDKTTWYELSSFIVHMGDSSNGHFKCFAKLDDQKWYLYDDLEEEPATCYYDVLQAKYKSISPITDQKSIFDNFLLQKVNHLNFCDKEGKTISSIDSTYKIVCCFYRKNRAKNYESFISRIQNQIK